MKQRNNKSRQFAVARTSRFEMKHVIRAFCMKSQTVYSAKYLQLYEEGKHLDLINSSINPIDYSNAEHFAQDYFLNKFLSKWKGLNLGINLDEVALTSFKRCEEHCKIVNRELAERLNDQSFNSIISDAKEIIAKILGPFSYRKIDEFFGWGSGSTFELPRRKAALDTKVVKLPFTVTDSAYQLAENVLKRDLHWSSAILNVPVNDIVGDFSFVRKGVFEVVNGARVEFVEKNAKTNRTIAVEPRLNAYLQKGFGQFIRRRLKRFGIDLNNQGFNQDAAARAMADDLATLDLQNASDTLSKALVEELIPVDWFCALNSVRSKRMRINDEWIELEKFSSMGNGFTFELETLIFYAVSRAADVQNVSQLTPGRNVLVYGDDIVCCQESAPKIVEALTLCGFELNKEKSYLKGRFFESCGKHYFDGYDVTPVYQKENIYGITETIRLGNRLYRWIKRGVWDCNGDTSNSSNRNRFQTVYASVRRQYEGPNVRIPDDESGDDGWLTPRSELGEPDRNYGYPCTVILPVKGSRTPAHEEAMLSLWMYKAKSRGYGEPYNIIQLSLSSSAPFDGSHLGPDSAEHVAIGVRYVH